MDVNRWSLAAVKYYVQEITMAIGQCHNSAYEIPHRLLNCKSLRRSGNFMPSSGKYTDVSLPKTINLPQLKTLILFGLSISNVKSLFSSCSVLETLNIHDCDIQTENQKNLIVDSPSFKKFDYGHCHIQFMPQNDTMANIIKLRAPNLEDFTCKSFLAQDYSLENCCLLAKVSFCIKLHAAKEYENAERYSKLSSKEKDSYAKCLMKFLRAGYMVKEMRLSPGFLEVFSQAPDLLDCQPPRLCNLQYLTLELWFTRGCLRTISYLLKIAPHITKIFLESKESNLAGIGDDGEAGLPLPGILSHLKVVQLEEAQGYDAELKLLRFLSANAKVLEKVVIFFRSTTGSPDRAKQVEQFKDKLIAVPTASSSIFFLHKVNPM